MISIARLLLFFVITIGYDAFFRNTVKMNRRLTWCLHFRSLHWYCTLVVC